MAASLTFLGIKPSQALAHSLAQSFSGGPAGPLASCSSRSCTRYLNTSVRAPGDGLAIGTALGGRPSGEWPEAEATAFRPAPSQLRPAVAPPSRSHVEWDRWSMPRPPTHSSHALALKRSRWCSPHGHTRGWLRCMHNNVESVSLLCRGTPHTQPAIATASRTGSQCRRQGHPSTGFPAAVGPSVWQGRPVT